MYIFAMAKITFDNRNNQFYQSLKVAVDQYFEGKKIISAVKGILPQENELLNDFLLKIERFIS